MKRLLAAALTSLSCLLAQAASLPAPVRAEIDAVLARLEASGCQFNRNGAWYSGPEARAHLLRKLEYLEGKGAIHSAEQFIELAATRSSSSGQAYQVRCSGQPAVASQLWLNGQLAAIRGAAGKGRP